MTLVNGVGHQCTGNRISVAIYGKSTGGDNKVCSSKVKPQILANTTTIWNMQDLELKCKETLFDPDKPMAVRALTGAYRGAFCPNKVELEILDIISKQPRYFCSNINSSGNKVRNNRKIVHVAKEGHCF